MYLSSQATNEQQIRTFGSGPVKRREAISILGVAIAVRQGQELPHQGDDARLGSQVQGGQPLVLSLPPAVQDAGYHADVALCSCQLCRAVPIAILHPADISTVQSVQAM